MESPLLVLGARPQMALFASSGVLRGIAGCGVLSVRLTGIPCAALLDTKIAHFWIGHRVTKQDNR
jgi:hypothetical protein